MDGGRHFLKCLLNTIAEGWLQHPRKFHWHMTVCIIWEVLSGIWSSFFAHSSPSVNKVDCLWPFSFLSKALLKLRDYNLIYWYANICWLPWLRYTSQSDKILTKADKSLYRQRNNLKKLMILWHSVCASYNPCYVSTYISSNIKLSYLFYHNGCYI